MLDDRYLSDFCAFLNLMVHDLLKEIWLDELSICEDLLSPEEQLQIRFIFAGLVSVLGSPQVREEPELMTKLAQTELGETAIAALKTIAESQRDPSPRHRYGRRPSPFRGTP